MDRWDIWRARIFFSDRKLYLLRLREGGGCEVWEEQKKFKNVVARGVRMRFDNWGVWGRVVGDTQWPC